MAVITRHSVSGQNAGIGAVVTASFYLLIAIVAIVIAVPAAIATAS